MNPRLYVTAGDALGFSLANYDEDRPEKKVIVQITFRPGFGAPMNFDVGSSPVKEDRPWTLGEQRPAVVIDSYLAEDGWQTNSYGFSFWPNPTWESFMVNFTEYPAYIDQVVVDTWCVPEPATLSLLALAGLAALRRRK